ncbi:MAG: mycofactocin biosynthesis glycosyltransferase MftF [Desulfobacterales bacterium]|nr:mycofactocin biosynthesis glycosyltransferase MftF [Desulfobacterales bacterium]
MASSNRTAATNSLPLAYRLRPAARFDRLANGGGALVLGYPLRALFVHAEWHPALACLAGGDWVPRERIAAAMPDLPAEALESFLNTLIRKGYLAQAGFPRLAASEYPSVSVIIPVRDRPQEIQECLASLTRLDYPAAKREIIVVDDASRDDTPAVVEQFPVVRLIRMTQHRQAAFCRNRAAEAARGNILAFIDSDCLADPTWLKELVPAFRDDSLGALGGWVDAAFEDNGLDRYEKVKSALKMGSWFKRSEQAERFFYVPACNFLVRRDAFQEVGGFRESLHVGEDVDFCWRLQDAGYSLEYRPLGRVAHKHRNRLGAFCARRFDYGTSEPVLQSLHRARVKTLFLPWSETLFWLTAVLAIVAQSLLPLAAGGIMLLVDGIRKHRRLQTRQVPVTRRETYTAIIRGYLAFVYHCCSFVSRYYLIAVPLLTPLSPLAAAIMGGMHLMAGLVEFSVKQPRLNPLAFVFFFTLEQASYQSGVWWACIRRLNFNPVLPRVIHKRI